MRLSTLIGEFLRDAPKDVQTASHGFLVRGGFIRPVSAGIFSLLPLGNRVAQKVEAIIREEMNRVSGQEVLMPLVLPRELWEESGRFESVGRELLRFKDRNDKDMLLGMTHEEAVVHLARSELRSYKQLPFMLYQIQTKYRDEARPRAGLIRVREFRMKDAYSFHVNEKSLAEYYDEVHAAYERIFERLGFKNVVSIESDTGMMGGSVSHEFMAIADCGEDTIFSCERCGYRANKEVARSGLKFLSGEARPLEKVSTPGVKTIEGLATFLGVPASSTGKAVFYEDEVRKLYFVTIRGDLDVNETKLRNSVRVANLVPATEEAIRKVGAVPGYASPLHVKDRNVIFVFDRSIVESSNLVVGANEENQHFLNFNFARDIAGENSVVKIADVASARDGDPCPHCEGALQSDRGIEVGNIFQLGSKYTEAMGCRFLDEQGKSQIPVMGCYGIGVGRAMAAVVEQSRDDYGPIWPLSIAPYQIHLCAINMKEGDTSQRATALYEELTAEGFEVLFDDRDQKPGSAFSDADLIGIPFRIIISPKTLAVNSVEWKVRGKREGELVEWTCVVKRLREAIAGYALNCSSL